MSSQMNRTISEILTEKDLQALSKATLEELVLLCVEVIARLSRRTQQTTFEVLLRNIQRPVLRNGRRVH